jgi:hypothetical protein
MKRPYPKVAPIGGTVLRPGHLLAGIPSSGKNETEESGAAIGQAAEIKQLPWGARGIGWV